MGRNTRKPKPTKEIDHFLCHRSSKSKVGLYLRMPVYLILADYVTPSSGCVMLSWREIQGNIAFFEEKKRKKSFSIADSATKLGL